MVTPMRFAIVAVLVMVVSVGGWRAVRADQSGLDFKAFKVLILEGASKKIDDELAAVDAELASTIRRQPKRSGTR